MEPLTPTSSPSRLSPLPSGASHIVIPSLEVSRTRELLSCMKEESESLSCVFGTLQDQTMKLALFGETETTREINGLREYMKEQDRIHTEGLMEIQDILDDFIETGFLEHLKKRAYQEIEDEIDLLVKEQVALHLNVHIPQELQDEVAQQKRESENLRIQLHNSESRHINAFVESDQQNDNLHTIYMSNGSVSAQFPKTLKELFSLDAKTCKTLMLDYEIPNTSDIRDRNLNRFMQFCGVTYQLVSTNYS